MVKHFCDICGLELLECRSRAGYKVFKRKVEKPHDGMRWVEIEAHEQCVKALLEKKWENENNDDNPLKKVKTSEPLTVNKWSGAGW